MTLLWILGIVLVAGVVFYALGAARALRDWLRRRLA